MCGLNAAPFLHACVDSILAQSFGNFELLFMDDGSTDDTYEIVRSFEDARIRTFRHERNQGIAASINELAIQANAEILVRHDADDISAPNRLERQRQFMADHPDVIVVGTGIELINASGQRIADWNYPTEDDEIRSASLEHSPFANPTTAIRKAAFYAVRGYRTEFQSCEDYDFFLRVAEHGRLANLPECLYKLRRHDNNQTIRWGKKQLYFHLLAQLSARSRAANGQDIALPRATEDLDRFMLTRYKMALDDAAPWIADQLFVRTEQAITCGNYASAFRVFASACGVDFQKWRFRWFAGKLWAQLVKGIQ